MAVDDAVSDLIRPGKELRTSRAKSNDFTAPVVPIHVEHWGGMICLFYLFFVNFEHWGDAARSTFASFVSYVRLPLANSNLHQHSTALDYRCNNTLMSTTADTKCWGGCSRNVGGMHPPQDRHHCTTRIPAGSVHAYQWRLEAKKTRGAASDKF